MASISLDRFLKLLQPDNTELSNNAELKNSAVSNRLILISSLNQPDSSINQKPVFNSSNKAESHLIHYV